MRDRSSTRCSQRRFAEPRSALYGASGMLRGRKRRRMKPVAEPCATGFGSGMKQGCGERNGCATSLYAKGLHIAEGDSAHGYALQGFTCWVTGCCLEHW